MTCRCCGADTNAFYEDYFHCLTCKAILLHPRHHLSHEAEKTHYAFHENHLENEGYVRMFEAFLTFIDSFGPYDERVLDFGCGPSPVLAHLLQTPTNTVRYFDPYFFPDTPYASDQYDLITSTEVFEHLTNPCAVLAHLANLLPPKGLLALMTHFHHDDQAHFASWWYPKDPTHIAFYTPRTFEILGQKTGLHVKGHNGKNMIVLGKD